MVDELLLDEDDIINDVNGVGILCPLTVLDEQGDVEVNWCDLL